MKGIAIAIETIVYLILALTVMVVAMMFFFSQGGKAQTDFEIESARSSTCASYQYYDTQCLSTANVPAATVKAVTDACQKYSERRGLGLPCGSGDQIKCIQLCCVSCPQPKTKT